MIHVHRVYLGYYKTDFSQTFPQNDATMASNQIVISADLENVGKGHILAKDLGYH